MTYPDAAVERYILDHFIPVQFNVVEQPEVKARFYTDWTPTIMIQNVAGREARRSEGYLGPHEFVGELSIGRLKAALYDHEYRLVIDLANDARMLTKGDALREPEAFYWAAVAAYRGSGDGKKLSDGWDELIAKFPDSDWAKRGDI